MSIAFFAKRGALEKKPPHGEPCTRCGLCCLAALCPLAEAVFGSRPGPCPALGWDAKGSSCGLVNATADSNKEMSEAAKLLIGSQSGCDCRLQGEPANVEFYAKLAQEDGDNADAVLAAKKLWGME